MPNGTHSEEWLAQAAELALLPVTIANLRRDHTARPDGMCASCTTGGTGIHETEWPCALWHVATAAKGIAERRVAEAQIPEQR